MSGSKRRHPPLRRKDKFPQHLVERVRARERQEMQDRRLAEEKVDRRNYLEDVIERGMQTFMEVGQALKEIKDKKLWKPEYASFDDYSYQRWDWTPRRSNMMIRAVETVKILGPPFPANEAICRELAKVIEQDPELGRAAWAAFISENPNPTAKETKAFLRNFLREEPSARPAPQPTPMDSFLKRTLKYIESTLSELDPKQRSAYLIALHRYARDSMYLSMGMYRHLKSHKVAGFIDYTEAMKHGIGVPDDYDFHLTHTHAEVLDRQEKTEAAPYKKPPGPTQR
jgi:hypothetical protein